MISYLFVFLFILIPSVIAHIPNVLIHQLDQVTFDTFLSQTITTSKPILIQFYAPWCTHCRRFSPTFQQIAIETQKQAYISRINGDANPSLMLRFRVSGFPSFYLIHNQNVYKFTGKRDYDHLVQFVQSKGMNHGHKLDLFIGPLNSYWRIVSSFFVLINKCTTYLINYEKSGQSLALLVFAIVIAVLLFMIILLTILTTPVKRSNSNRPQQHQHNE